MMPIPMRFGHFEVGLRGPLDVRLLAMQKLAQLLVDPQHPVIAIIIVAVVAPVLVLVLLLPRGL